MVHVFHYLSPLGGLTLFSDGTYLTGLNFNSPKYCADIEYQKTNLPVFNQTVKWLDIYFSGKAPKFTPPLLLQTTPFRKIVWEIMLKIPFGKTMTYGEIAAQIACQKGIKKMSAQAVGGAVGHNAIAIIIPCHRVIGAKGKLTGYSGGIDRKIYLLNLESKNKVYF